MGIKNVTSSDIPHFSRFTNSGTSNFLLLVYLIVVALDGLMVSPFSSAHSGATTGGTCVLYRAANSWISSKWGNRMIVCVSQNFVCFTVQFTFLCCPLKSSWRPDKGDTTPTCGIPLPDLFSFDFSYDGNIITWLLN